MFCRTGKDIHKNKKWDALKNGTHLDVYHCCQRCCRHWWHKNRLIFVDAKARGRVESLFVQIYAAYIGNIALLFKLSGGIFITGGIAAKILKKMQPEDFINAYLNRERMSSLVAQIAVYLVTNKRIGVLGLCQKQ